MTHPDDIPQPPISPPAEPETYFYLECDECAHRCHEDEAEPNEICDECEEGVMELIEDDTSPWEDDDRHG